jgi:hypothetical protein
VLDQEGRFDVVPGWSAQASDETTKGTGPDGGAAQLVWILPDEADQHLLAVLALSPSALVVRPPDSLPLPELAAMLEVCWVALSTPSAD